MNLRSAYIGLLALLLTACDTDYRRYSFHDYKEASEAGWAGSDIKALYFLPSSARNIAIVDKADSSDVWVKFDIQRDWKVSVDICQPDTTGEIILPNQSFSKKVDWTPIWMRKPKSIGSNRTLNKIEFYVCRKTTTQFMAIDRSTNTAYFWQRIY